MRKDCFRVGMTHYHILLQELLDRGRLFDAKEAERKGISHQLLQYYCLAGKLKRVACGVFAPAGWCATPESRVDILQLKCEEFTLCLDSAMHFHGILTEPAKDVWIALKQGARTPTSNPCVKCVRVIPEMYEYGQETHLVNGRPLKVYSPARTAVDYFRYRNKLGEERAIGNMLAIYRKGLASIDDIKAIAQNCHASKAIMPYLSILKLA